MDNTSHILSLSDLYTKHSHRAESTVSRLASSSGATLGRLRSGHTITVRRAARTLQWFSDHWPADLPWPADIPRPEPAEDSPHAKALAEQAGLDLNNSVNDSESGPYALNASGRIASPRALVTSFYAGYAERGLDPTALIESMLNTYYQVVRQYADGKPRAMQTPRTGTHAAKMLTTLMAAGDVRFAERVERAAAHERFGAQMGYR